MYTYCGQVASPNLIGAHYQDGEYSPITFPFDSATKNLDSWRISPTGIIDLDSFSTLTEWDKDFTTGTGSPVMTITEATEPSTSIFEESWQDFVTLGSPVLHKDVFGKFEGLLTMCMHPIHSWPRM